MGTVKMKYMISADLTELQTLEAKIHQWMIDNVKDYNATKWSEIYKHPTLALYALSIKDTDPRNPYDVLALAEKLKTIDSLADEWFTVKNQTKTLEKVV